MAGRRFPRDGDTAPGDEPGAVSFPHPGGSGQAGPPSRIVRLADLLPAAQVVPAAARAGSDEPQYGALGGRDVSGEDTPGPEAAGPEARRPGAHLRGRRRRDTRGGGAGACANGPTTPTEGPPRVDSEAPDDSQDGPPYESLFGPDDDGGRRKRRERPPATALQRALGLLTRREHSRKELTRKLVSRGVDAAEVEAAVDKLSAAGWQDERRFAENLVRARAAAGYGPLHIRAELATHDLPSELRAKALESFEGDWMEVAVDVARRRCGRIEDARLRERKAADLLIRRGFPADVARAAARSIPDGD